MTFSLELELRFELKIRLKMRGSESSAPRADPKTLVDGLTSVSVAYCRRKGIFAAEVALNGFHFPVFKPEILHIPE